MARNPNRNTAAQNARIEFFIDTAGEYRWRVYAQNGNQVGESGEGYKRRSGAEKGFNALYAAMMALPGPARNVSVTKRRTRATAVASEDAIAQSKPEPVE